MLFFEKTYIAYIMICSFAAVLLLIWLSLGQHGLIDLYTMQKEREKYLALVNDLKEKNRVLAAEIIRLKNDQKYFESVARKELGLVKENEIIYRFKSDSKENKKNN